LTVYSPTISATSEECPRCRAKLGKVSRLFRSQLPPRLQDRTSKAFDAGGQEIAPAP
jgi:hypothetical protein